MQMERQQSSEFESVRFHPNRHVKVFINREPYNFEAHWHIPLEAVMPLENDYTIECEGIRRCIGEREIALIAPGAVHSIEAPDRGSRVYIQADLSCFPQIREVDLLFSMLPPLTVIGKEAPGHIWRTASELMEQIRNDYFGKRSFPEIAVYAGLFRILSLAGEMFSASREETSSGGSRRTEEIRYKYKDLFGAVCEYIREHCTEDITLEQTACRAGFSKYHFAHLFHDFTGTTFCKYLNQQRIMLAQRLLADPDYTVTRVAMECGYSSLSSFNRMFRQMKGCTPSEFRRLHCSLFHGA